MTYQSTNIIFLLQSINSAKQPSNKSCRKEPRAHENGLRVTTPDNFIFRSHSIHQTDAHVPPASKSHRVAGTGALFKLELGINIGYYSIFVCI